MTPCVRATCPRTPPSTTTGWGSPGWTGEWRHTSPSWNPSQTNKCLLTFPTKSSSKRKVYYDHSQLSKNHLKYLTKKATWTIGYQRIYIQPLKRSKVLFSWISHRRSVGTQRSQSAHLNILVEPVNFTHFPQRTVLILAVVGKGSLWKNLLKFLGSWILERRGFY